MTAGPRLPAWCETYTDTITVDLEATSAGTTLFDLPLTRTVALEHVEFLGVEAYTMTTSGTGTSTVQVQLLFEGSPVTEVTPGGTLTTGGSPISLTTDTGLVVDAAAQEENADAIRFLVTHGSGGMTTTVRGMHADDAVNAVFIVGEFVPDGPHLSTPLGTWGPVTVVDSETTEWTTIDDFPPVATADLDRLARLVWSSFTLSGDISTSFETQVLVENGVMLTMDDWTSPSQSQAPPEPRWVTARAGLVIDETLAALIDGSDLIGLRYRCHSQGTGTVTFTFTNAPVLNAFYHAFAEIPGDTNADATVDVQDLVNVVLDWGTDGAAHRGDVNESGSVDVEDLAIVITSWGPCT